MATIYRFIIEQKSSSQVADSGGRQVRVASSKKTVSKKGKMVSLFSGENGGVEHNRKMRAINPLLNRMTGGYWEKGMRLTRAGLGLIKRNNQTGHIGIGGPALAIIIQMIIIAVLKIQRNEQLKAERLNAQNFKQMENGVNAIHGQYKITTNYWNGRQTYNQNK